MRLARLMLLAALALLAACGSGHERATTISPASPTAAAKQKAAAADVLKRSLLSLDDMPTGWASSEVDNSSSTGGGPISGSGPSFCNSTPVLQSASSQLEADFTDGQFDLLYQTIAVYPANGAKKAMDTLVSSMSGCTSWFLPSPDGTGITLQIRPVSFPKLGDQTVAVRMDGSSGLVAAAIDLVLIRRADYIELLAHIAGGLGLAKVDSAATELIARAADTKLGAAMR